MLVLQDRYDALSMLEWYRHDAKHRSMDSAEAMDWTDSLSKRPVGSVEAVEPMQCLRAVDAENEGVAFVPAHSTPVRYTYTEFEATLRC